MINFDKKIRILADLIQKQTHERLDRRTAKTWESMGKAATPEEIHKFNTPHAKTYIRHGKKYTKIDVDSSGKYMVVNETGEIYGIKAYGVIHKGHYYGTLDTINDYNWGDYAAYKIK